LLAALLLSPHAFAQTTLPQPGFNSTGPILPMGAGGANVMNLLSNGTVGIGTNAPQATLDVQGEAKIGNTGVICGSANAGAIRYNSKVVPTRMEYCDGTTWTPVGGGTLQWTDAWINLDSMLSRVPDL
jgi:hypothetical protein